MRAAGEELLAVQSGERTKWQVCMEQEMMVKWRPGRQNMGQ